MKNKTLYAIIYLAFALFFNSCTSDNNGEDITVFSMSETMMSTCEFEEAKIEDVKNEIRFFGKIEADNNKTTHVFSNVSGIVSEINIGLGDYVEQGEILAEIRSSEVARYEHERLEANKELSIAEKNLQVAKDLFLGKLNSEKDVIQAELELDKAAANVTKINEIFNIYKFKSGSIFPVIAPISGFVITKNINRNELLRADEEQPLFSIANTNEIWAVAQVNESDISYIKEGYQTKVKTLAFPDLDYKGVIEKIYNVIDPATKSMKFRVRIKNSDFKLMPDMNCTVNVSYSENKEMVTVPSSALIFDKSKYWVMVFKDKYNIETRQVEIYRQLGNTSFIKVGLDKGETVISKNGLLIYDEIND